MLRAARTVNIPERLTHQVLRFPVIFRNLAADDISVGGGLFYIVVIHDFLILS